MLLLAAPIAPPTSGIEVGGWRQSGPIEIEIVGADGSATWRTAPYVTRRATVRSGVLTTPNGSRLQVSDDFRSAKGGLTLRRTVEVLAVGVSETAFSSRFSLASPVPARIRDREFFMPGVWYRHNEDVPKRAVASDPDARLVLVREDRLPLPLAMARDSKSGAMIALVHERPDGATFGGDDFTARITDERMRYGSLGFVNDGRLRIAFQFPGSEGDRTTLHPGGDMGAPRSHPLRVGFTQTYDLRIETGRSRGYADAVQRTWRRAFDDADPQAPRVDLDRVYRASHDLLARVAVRYHGIPSVPFQAKLPTGEVIDTSSQMGFVGKALPVAALMLREAIRTGDPGRQRQAEDVIDFWVAQSMNASGVPKTWYDIHTDGPVTWRDYPTHVRIASDGMLGVLRAWEVRKRPEWLAYARRFGDFLVAQQSGDGSLPARWKWDGTVDRYWTNATDQAIPFLAALHLATGDTRYRRAALRAGGFSLKTLHAAYRYVGGAPDNPNVTDKEAGVLAMQGFLALYDLTHDRRWIAPAVQAATFSETWTYAWNVPIPADDPGVVFPRGRTTLGMSLIATGHSGADAFMAIAPYDFYRLYLLTHQAHFLRFARLAMNGPRGLIDTDGSLGYAVPGLLMEAMSLAPRRGHGVSGWLPWLTVAVLEPQERFREAFGTDDLDRIERLPWAERLRRTTVIDAGRASVGVGMARR